MFHTYVPGNRDALFPNAYLFGPTLDNNRLIEQRGLSCRLVDLLAACEAVKIPRC